MEATGATAVEWATEEACTETPTGELARLVLCFVPSLTSEAFFFSLPFSFPLLSQSQASWYGHGSWNGHRRRSTRSELLQHVFHFSALS